MTGMENSSSATSTTTTVSAADKGMSSESVKRCGGFLKGVGTSDTIPPQFEDQGIILRFHKGTPQGRSNRARSSLLLSLRQTFRYGTKFHSSSSKSDPFCFFFSPFTLKFCLNVYGGLHGGAVASVAEMVSIACARTVVGKDKELFLGELGISYLSAAPRNAELNVNASVVRSGRNLTVIAVEFKVKDSERLAYTSRATFYNMPVASL
ncbi:hypothetical protein HYC85_016541 [Camellia sinensis]|uniref:Thioesterase domain-containing protein n=1 Tax=Camellia sinensis TaxID=4442 RepID=A0A7J7GZW8_CAMSI|nr:hypothetical protein HYC85_016541 [Camellia sinensis]